MTFRIFVTGSGIATDAETLLRNEGCVLLQGDPGDTATEIAQKIADFCPDALIVRQGNISEDVIAASPKLRVICKHGTGTDNIDVKAASSLNIPVMYTPNANYESVAEHTLALILSLYRKIPDQDRKVRSGKFDKKHFSGQELLGKTLGLVGFGRVARRLSELVAPFDVKVIVYHPSGKKEKLPSHISKVASLTDILTHSDIVSLHAPLTTETQGMIDSRAFAKMKNGACLINTARGLLVNEAHLIKALEDGKLGGAALDTYEVEPPAAGSPLHSFDNVVLTMHTAGNSDSSLRKMAMGSARNVLAALRNEPLDPSSLKNAEQISRDLLTDSVDDS